MYIEGMTARQTERLHRECLKFGVDFPEENFHKQEDVAIIIRWSKSKLDQPSDELVRQKLLAAGCFGVPAPRPIVWNF